MKQVNQQELDHICAINHLLISMNNAEHNFDKDYVESINCFAECYIAILTILSFPTNEHVILHHCLGSLSSLYNIFFCLA